MTHDVMPSIATKPLTRAATLAVVLLVALMACGGGTYVPRGDPLGTPTAGMLGPRNPVEPLIRNHAHLDKAVAARAHLSHDVTPTGRRIDIISAGTFGAPV